MSPVRSLGRAVVVDFGLGSEKRTFFECLDLEGVLGCWLTDAVRFIGDMTSALRLLRRRAIGRSDSECSVAMVEW